MGASCCKPALDVLDVHGVDEFPAWSNAWTFTYFVEVSLLAAIRDVLIRASTSDLPMGSPFDHANASQSFRFTECDVALKVRGAGDSYFFPDDNVHSIWCIVKQWEVGISVVVECEAPTS